MQTGVVSVDGANLRYVREGQGPPLLVVGSATYYPKAFSQNLREHLDLIFFDSRHFVPDYTPDASAESLTLEHFARDIEGVQNALGLERAAVLGHSVHAQIALEYARMRPDRVSQLILVAGVPFSIPACQQEAAQLFDAEASPRRKELLAIGEAALEAKLAAAPPTRSFAVSYFARAPLYWADAEYDASALLAGLENGPAFGHLFEAVPRENAVRRSLEEVTMPVLAVAGRLDFAVPHRAWERLVSGLGHVTYVLLENDSHNPQTESPERFDALLLGWLSNVTPKLEGLTAKETTRAGETD